LNYNGSSGQHPQDKYEESGTVLKHTVTAIFLSCSWLLPIPQAALADDHWQSTQPANIYSPALCPSRTADTMTRVETDSDPDVPIRLDADSAQISNENLYILEGNAEIRYGTHRLQADKITYNEAEGTIIAEGAVRLASPTLVVEGRNARLSTTTGTGELEQIRYTLPARHARGSADRLELKGRDKVVLDKTLFTTCPEGNTDWQLTAGKITLDQATGSGTARNARLTFKGLPVLYSPVIGFPIDDRRKSGLLAPRLGTSGETGIDISAPWYWNIAPDRDATITPRLMTSRGFMLGGEFRYLNKRSQGQLDFEYLPSDNKFGNEDRSLFAIRHNGKPFSRLVTHINAGNVSDDDYFRDLGGNRLDVSQTHLERTAGVTWHGDAWTLAARVQDYQTIDSTLLAADEPYKRLPQINLDISPVKKLRGLQFSMNSELTRFDRNDRVTGTRLDLQPRLRLPVYHSGWFIDPSVSIRHTRYSLDDVDPGDPESPTRTIPVASIDAGSFFEREFRWGNTNLVQTLEPRIFYLYVPFEDQSDIPVFDTGEYDFNFWQLFRENRFSGGDRMGDANQAALALTSRLINPANGIQQVSASVGELFYFRDRRVTLPGDSTETGNSSDLVASLSVQFSKNWQTRAGILWDPEDSSTSRGNVQLQYRTDERRLFNLGYRFRRDVLEQVDTSILWPLNPSWHIVSRWNYSLADNKTLNALAGIGYESCCWGLQLVGRSFVNDDNGGRNTAVYLQIELKGLVGLGSKIDRLLERDILGYPDY
jgi:LPS-assembly protein